MIKRYEVFYLIFNYLNEIDNEKIIFRTNYYFLAKLFLIYKIIIYKNLIKNKHMGIYCYDYKKHDYIIQYSCFLIR